ncbi:hypothetical protein AAFP30_22310 [Gordonia sp. CPCC 205515]|uniref:hypothetical protein n=1 Tax=Gordonia sp. CPCC 205515 TaxID=3140791 RepID=UPI003AF3C3BD
MSATADRNYWCDRVADACNQLEPHSLTTEQLAAFAVFLETLMGTHGKPQRPALTLVPTGGAS